MNRRDFLKTTALAGAAATALGRRAAFAQAAPGDILNASYDIARELFAAINPAFVDYWQKKNGQQVTVKQSHAGTSKQARSVVEGLQADVVTFNQVPDISFLADKGFVAKDWQGRFPNNASPWYSFAAFLVRKGNPKTIKDWPDLARPDVKLVFPNPKTSGNARYTYLSAFADALAKNGNDLDKAKAVVGRTLANVAVFDTGGRGSTTTFVEREIGDVLITFEAEVNAVRREYGADKFEVVLPPSSVLGEFPVAVVDKVVDKRGSRALAQGYLDFLYGEAAQEIAAKNFHRVDNAAVKAKYAAQFPPVKLVTVDAVFGGWNQASREHFADGAILDQLMTRR
jgi:sulfate transport system substrate-binding protein